MYIRASSSSVKVCEPDSIGSNLVYVGSPDLAAEASHIGEAQVIGDHNKEIRSFSHVDRYVVEEYPRWIWQCKSTLEKKRRKKRQKKDQQY